MIMDLADLGNLIDHTSELLITDEKWTVLYRNHALDFTEEQWARWSMLYREETVEETGLSWEVADKAAGKYYNVRSFPDRSKGELRLIHHIYDVSDYALIFRELTAYSSEWKKLASCQDELIGNLSADPSRCLDVAIKYFSVPYAVLYLRVRGEVFRYVKTKGEAQIASEKTESTDVDFTASAGAVVELLDFPDRHHICCCSGKAAGAVDYAMFCHVPDEKEQRLHAMLYNEFKLYIENALLQEQIVYENEHDHMTGLYNKGKFLELKQTLFRTGSGIAVYNMDVNYLKRVNDTMGHEAGNALICKAGNSIKNISGERVFGFRVGGDEFLVVAVNVTEEEANEILSSWRKGLSKLNEDKETPECIIACGLSYQAAPYEFEKVMERADALMYEDKRRIKIARGDDPDQR